MHLSILGIGGDQNRDKIISYIHRRLQISFKFWTSPSFTVSVLPMKLLLLILVIVARSKSSFEGFISGVKAKNGKIVTAQNNNYKKRPFWRGQYSRTMCFGSWLSLVPSSFCFTTSVPEVLTSFFPSPCTSDVCEIVPEIAFPHRHFDS